MDKAISNTKLAKQKSGDEDVHEPDLFCAPFPMKLHQILEDAEKLGFTSTIAWMDDGESFAIVDKDRLEHEIMPKYFMSGKFKSFQRSLNLWGFTCERNEGLIHPRIASRRHHPLFLRGKVHLCKKMRRTRVKKPGIRSRNKNKDVDSVHVVNGEPTQVTDQAASTNETVSTANQSIPYCEGQVSFQSSYVQRILPCTFQAYSSPYHFGSSSLLRLDMQSVVNRSLSLVAPIMERSPQSLTHMQEDALLRYLIACRVRTIKGHEGTQTKFHCNSLQPKHPSQDKAL